jgi:hypothetical protein
MALKPFDGKLDEPGTSTPALQPFDGVLDSEKTGAARRLGDVGISLAKGVIGVPEAAVGIADLVTGGQAGKVLENEGGAVGFRPKQAKAMLDEYLSPEQKAANRAVQKADGFFPTIGAMVENPSTIVNSAVESAPSMIVGAGAGGAAARLAAPMLERGAAKLTAEQLAKRAATTDIAAGAFGEGAAAAGQNAEQVRQESKDGLLTGTQSAILAGSGALTGAIGFGAGKLANQLGIGDVQTMAARGKLGAAGAEAAAAGAEKNVFRKVGEGVLTEGVLQEMPQSAQEQAAQNLAQGKPIGEGVGSASAAGLMAGGLMGGAAAPLGGAEPAPAKPPGPLARAAALALPAPVGSMPGELPQLPAPGVVPRGGNPAGATEMPGAGGTGGYQDPIDVAAQTVAPGAAGAETPLLPPTQARALDYHEADAADQAMYRHVFGPHEDDDVTDVVDKNEITHPSDYSSLLDDDIPWDAPGTGSYVDFLRTMGATDQEIADAIADEQRDAQEGAARGPQAQADGSGEPSSNARPPRIQTQAQGPGVASEDASSSQAPAADVSPASSVRAPAAPAPSAVPVAQAPSQHDAAGLVSGPASHAPAAPAPKPPHALTGLGVAATPEAVTEKLKALRQELDATDPAHVGTRTLIERNIADAGRWLTENGHPLPEIGHKAPAAGLPQSEEDAAGDLDPLGYDAKKLADTYSMEQLNTLYDQVRRDHSNPVVDGGPVEDGRASKHRLNPEGRAKEKALKEALGVVYDRSKQGAPKVNKLAEAKAKRDAEKAAEHAKREAEHDATVASGKYADVDPKEDPAAPQWADPERHQVSKSDPGPGLAMYGAKQIGTNADGHPVYESGTLRTVVAGDYTVNELSGDNGERDPHFRTTEENDEPVGSARLTPEARASEQDRTAGMNAWAAVDEQAEDAADRLDLTPAISQAHTWDNDDVNGYDVVLSTKGAAGGGFEFEVTTTAPGGKPETATFATAEEAEAHVRKVTGYEGMGFDLEAYYKENGIHDAGPEFTKDEQDAALKMLPVGTVVQSMHMSPSVTGRVEAIHGPSKGEWDDHYATQVVIHWMDDGKPRRKGGHGANAYFSDFYVRDGKLLTRGRSGARETAEEWKVLEAAPAGDGWVEGNDSPNPNNKTWDKDGNQILQTGPRTFVVSGAPSNPNSSQGTYHSLQAAKAAFDAPAAAPAPKVNKIAEGKAKRDLNAKTIPEMTDAELVQALELFGPDHKRAPKIQKEIEKRAAATNGQQKKPGVTPTSENSAPPRSESSESATTVANGQQPPKGWAAWWNKELAGAKGAGEARTKAFKAAGLTRPAGGPTPNRILWTHLFPQEHAALQALYRSGWTPDTPSASSPVVSTPRDPATPPSQARGPVVPTSLQDARKALTDGERILVHAGTEHEETVWLEEIKVGQKGQTYVVKSKSSDSPVTITKGPVGPDRTMGWGRFDAADQAVKGMEFTPSAGSPVVSAPPAARSIARQWDEAKPAQRREMLKAAGYTDGDQARVLSGTDWNQLTDPVRKALDKHKPAPTDADLLRAEQATSWEGHEFADRIRAMRDSLVNSGEKALETWNAIEAGIKMEIARGRLTEESLTFREGIARKALANSATVRPKAKRTPTTIESLQGTDPAFAAMPEPILAAAVDKLNEYGAQLAELGFADHHEVHPGAPADAVALADKMRAVDRSLMLLAPARYQFAKGYKNADGTKLALHEDYASEVLGIRTRDYPNVDMSQVLTAGGVRQKPLKKADFSDNKLFTADKVAAARARMKAKLGRLNSGFDPELMVDGMTIAGAYIEAGVRSFADFTRSMVADMGDAIKPYLKSFYNGARDFPGLDTKGMDDHATVAAADVDALAKEEEAAPPAPAPSPAPAPAPLKSDGRNARDLDQPEGKDGWEHLGYVSGNDGVSYEVDYRTVREVEDGRLTAIRQVRIYDSNSGSYMAAWEWKSSKFASQFLDGLGIETATFHYALSDKTSDAFGANASDGDALWATYGRDILSEVKRKEGKAATGKAPEQPALPKPTGKQSLGDSFYEAIKANQMPADNPALRKMVEAFDGQPADQARMKEAQEELEAAIARTARDIVAKNKKEGPRTTFAILRRLYDSQPNLNIRTSTSIANQAYSTPAPLAFLASELTGIQPGQSVLEPTAGTGMLLMGATPSKAHANELNKFRVGLLLDQGFDVTNRDATEGFGKDKFDAVITNPPFGSIKNDKGDPIKERVDGYLIGQIDHLIAARALEAMKADGRATLIIGANKVAGGMSTDDRIFFNWLYSHYNVTSHFEVNGDLYQRQGAGWPVRVITINGRQASSKIAPVVGTIQRADTWDQVYDHFATSLDASRAPQSGASTSPVGTGTGQAGTGPVSRPVRTQTAGSGGRGSSGSSSGSGNVAGPGAGALANSGQQPTAPVGPGIDEQRLNADPVGPDRLDAAGQRARDNAAAGSKKPAGNPDTLAAADNQFQAQYVPRSARKDAGVLIPINMQQPTQDALSKLEDAVGDIDQYAMRELGYKNVAELHQAFMGLQVDSVASAIYQIENGKAIVIADQTGIGKGRQAAAIIRWAERKGHVPVFVSVKPSLFTDMYGDLRNIGTTNIHPFIMNSDQWIADDDGGKLYANKPVGHKRVIEGITNSGQLPKGTNAVFMTYSQINTDNAQRAAITALAPRAVFILDESHNAAGDSSTGAFVRGALDAAKGVTYLSATYAKRPDNMPLYFKTDMGQAAADDEGLMTAMAAGGLPLQTVVSNNLVKAGQMFRRERSYDGVTFETVVDTGNRAEHEEMSDRTTEALRAIVGADRMFHNVFVAQMQEEMQAQGSSIIDNAGNQATASVDHTEFSSVVHNFVKQMLLGLKAQESADRAIAALKRGEKPIIAVENTMGSFLTEYAAANGISHGGDLGSFDYRTVLSRALARTLFITERTPTGDKVKRKISLSQLDPVTRAAYDEAQAVIDALDISIPVSPIDWMRSQIQKAGYSVAEITGRNLSVDYGSKRTPTMSAVDQAEQKDKVRTTRLFNSGKLDALIVNVAGSTGISLHASETFEDQRPRHMIVAQAASDINIFMQMLGRIHRTGQVKLPRYTLLSADLPTEKRPSAVLSGKMKSLNANTSSNTDSATSVKVQDMLNKYGDLVVGQYLADNPSLAFELGILDGMSDNGPREDVARTATGRLALQPIAVQKAFYEEIEGQYQTLLDYLNKTNQNELEPRTFDFDAQETRQEVLFEGADPNSPFGEDAIYGEYSIKAQGKPMKLAEIKAAMADNLGGKTGAEHAVSIVNGLAPAYRAFHAALEPESAAAADHTARTGIDFIKSHAIGSMFQLSINGEPYNAVVTNIRNTHKKGGNPFSLSKMQVTVALNGSLRSVTVPGSRFESITTNVLPPASYTVDGVFRLNDEKSDRNEREVAKIVTGNLLAAYGEIQGARGTIITFTKQDGTTDQGILLPKAFTLKGNTRGDFRLENGAKALQFLQQSQHKDIGRFGIMSRDGVVRVLPSGKGIRVQVPRSKLKGAKYFLDKGLIATFGDFVSSGNFMVADADGAAAIKGLDQLMKKQALYALPSMSEEAKAITGHVSRGDTEQLSAADGVDTLDAESGPSSVKVDTVFANADRTAKAEKMAARLGVKFSAVEPGDVGEVMAQSLQAVRTTAKRLFGHDVVFVKFPPGVPPLFNGAVSVKIPGTVFIRIDAARPHMAVLGHELLHHLRTLDPRLYNDLVNRLETMLKSDGMARYYGTIEAAYAKHGREVPTHWDEELIADIVGDFFMDPHFWSQLGDQGKPGLFRMVTNAIVKFLDRLKRLMTGMAPFGTEQYLSDVDAARNAVAQAMSQFSAGQLANPDRQAVANARTSSNLSVANDGAELLSIASNPKELAQRARQAATDYLKTPGKLSWWHKTVGTPYNLAQRSPVFKRVFDSVQNFLKDVSLYATEAADLAPRILPKLERLADLKKSPISAADAKAIGAPIFEGTLAWTRDARNGGKPIKVDPEDDGITPGIVWTPAELKSQFGLTGEQTPGGKWTGQIGLYQEFRAAIDKSLTDLAVSDMVRFGGDDVAAVRDRAMEAGDASAAAKILAEHLGDLAEKTPKRAGVLLDSATKILAKAERANDLMKRGYAPLSRFGNHSVDVLDAKGKRLFFGLFESGPEAAKKARDLAVLFPGSKITRGTMSQEQHKLFAGVTPETLELFGEMLNLEGRSDDGASQAFQEYLKLAKSNRSAMKRLIQRKGTEGFSEDAGRVLAGFVFSNARQIAGNLHAGEIKKSTADVAKESGELKDAAIKLTSYVSNPEEEAAGFRGLLFTQYIGGSIASALVNLTQPLQTTLPYLSQFGGIGNAAKHVRRAASDALKDKTGDAELDRAIKHAEELGIISPQEVHHLMAQARGAATLKAGDGTRLGDAQATAQNHLSRLQFAWGKLFSTAEQYNRRLTFIAAWRLSKARGDSNPMAFAEKTIAETQFVANKGNRPRWARGAVGSTLFTFKSYSVNFVELMARMATAGKPGSPERAAGQRAAALMLGVLFLMGGAGGLPFADDIGDLIDALMQRLGYNFNTKAKREEFLEDVFGRAGGQFVERGVSGISGMPLDVSGRMGMGNLIPGTGLLVKKLDHSRDVGELFGPAGDFVKRAFTGAGQLAEGKPVDAALSMAPKAITNLNQGRDMAMTGMYRDAGGKKILDTNGFEALTKAIGFQPNSVARVQSATFDVQNMIAQNKMRASEISSKWAAGVAQKDPAMVAEARAELMRWNENNPTSRIKIDVADVMRRARTLNTDKATRIEKTAPQAIRAEVRRSLENDVQR